MFLNSYPIKLDNHGAGVLDASQQSVATGGADYSRVSAGNGVRNVSILVIYQVHSIIIVIINWGIPNQTVECLYFCLFCI